MTALNQTILVGLVNRIADRNSELGRGNCPRKRTPAKTTKAPSNPFAAPADVAKNRPPVQFGQNPVSYTKS